jgi:hypothetical protein
MRGWEDRCGQYLETRYTFITLRRGTDILAHQDMRDIASICPVLASSRKLKSHLVTFADGTTIRIFPNLDQHEKLIKKLESYLGKAD